MAAINGTYAGDKKVEPGQPVEVTSGMEIRFGSTVLRFEAPASDQAIASTEYAREVEEAEELEEYSGRIDCRRASCRRTDESAC